MLAIETSYLPPMTSRSLWWVVKTLCFDGPLLVALLLVLLLITLAGRIVGTAFVMILK